MRQRGKTSAAALTVPSQVAPLETIQRPDAPYDLTDEQTAEWWAVVNRMPADWFPRETHGLLAQYCRHVVSARRVAQMIEGIRAGMDKAIKDGEDALTVQIKSTQALDRLFKMQEREGRAMSSLATRMRLTQQTTYDKSKKKPVEGARPWD